MINEFCNKCYECKHRADIFNSAHSQCINRDADVSGEEHGKKHGWFNWPWCFDPVWLTSCNGFEAKIQEVKI